MRSFSSLLLVFVVVVPVEVFMMIFFFRSTHGRLLKTQRERETEREFEEQRGYGWLEAGVDS